MSILLIGQTHINELVAPDGTITRSPGGTILNVGLGLKNLGRTVRIVTDFGLDADGELISEYAASKGIELWLRSDEERTTPTSVNRVSLDSAGAPSYRYDVSWDIPTRPESAACKLDLALLDPKSAAVDFACCLVEPGAEKVRDWLEVLHERCTIFFNINARPAYLGDRTTQAATIEAAARFTDVIKTSAEDIALVYGPSASIADVADIWHAHGTSLVVVTCGENGAYMFPAGADPVRIPPIDAERVDSTGAGDAFFAALIDGATRLSMSGAENRDHLRTASVPLVQSLGSYASTAASITISRPGVNPPTREEMAAVNESYHVE